MSKTPSAASALAPAPAPTGVLARRCECGNHTIAGATCAHCAQSSANAAASAAPAAIDAASGADAGPASPLARASTLAAVPARPAPARLPVATRPPARRRASAPLAAMVLPQRIDAAPGHEGEADRIADAALQRLSLPAASAPIGAEPLAEAAPIAELGTGRPLTASLRAAFERAFGWDFSGVRVHSDGAAHAAARRLGARAFAFARNLVFGDKVADPEAGEHRHLLAHELTHVVQQDLGAGAAPARSGLSQQVAAAPMLAQAAPLVTNVATSAAELGVGGTDITATATVAGRTTLAWSINPGGVAPAGVSVIGGGRRVRIRAVQPAPGTVVGGAALTIRAAVSGTPADNADSAAVRLVQVTSATYAANPALAAVPSLIPGAAPAGTAEPNRDGINGNSATVNAVTAPGARPVRVTLRRALGARVAGNVITPGAQTGDIRVRITDTATGARLNETQPVAAPVAGASGLMSELTVNAVPTRVSALAFAGGAGPYGVRNRITFQSSDAAHPPLTRIVGELITLNRNDFNLGPVNPPIGFNPAFVLALAVPANAWVDQLVTPTALPNVGDGRPAIDVNRFVGPGVPQLPRFWNFRQRFQYSSWRGAGAVVSRTFADGVHERSLRGSPAAGFQFRTDHRFGGVAAPPRNDPYAGNPLIVFSAVTATPNAAGATALAADGAATARLTVASSVAARSARWNVLSGDVVITAGNPAALPAAATLRAGVQAGPFRLRAADTIFPNRRADGRVRVAAVRLRNMRAAPSPVPVGTLSSVVTLNAEPGGRNIVFTVDPAAAAAGVTAALNANPPGVAVAATVTRPAAFTGVVTVTARDSVLAARTATTRIRFR